MISNKVNCKKKKFIDQKIQGIFLTFERGKKYFFLKELNALLHKQFMELQLSVEDEKKEKTSLEEEREVKDSKLEDQLFEFIELDCECILIIKTKKPIDPVKLLEKIFEDILNHKISNIKHICRLLPISCSSTIKHKEIQLLCERVLNPVFNSDKTFKFSVQVSKRSFNTMKTLDLIEIIVDHIQSLNEHIVDLKNFEKAVIVICYKNTICLSVVNRYQIFKKYSFQTLFKESCNTDSIYPTSRVII